MLTSENVNESNFKVRKRKTRYKFDYNKYVRDINNVISSKFYHPIIDNWNIIYYDLNVFHKMPIASCLLLDNEKSNEFFWLHILID